MQFIIAHIADDTAVCNVIAVDINDLCKAVIEVEEISALGIENIPYTVHIHDICSMTVHTCVCPYYMAPNPYIMAYLVCSAGMVNASAASVLPHIFIHSFCLAVVSSVIGKKKLWLGYRLCYGYRRSCLLCSCNGYRYCRR